VLLVFLLEIVPHKGRRALEDGLPSLPQLPMKYSRVCGDAIAVLVILGDLNW
jgi:hypothetical protein